LPEAVPIRGVMGDSQASLFAQGCFRPGMAKATFGSGTSVLLNIGASFRLVEGGTVTALADHLAQQKFDLKALMRTILQSQTYQRSSRPLPGTKASA
jgi:glycerol kinase